MEEVLAHDIFNDGSRTAFERPPDCFLKLREALTDIARERPCSINERDFVDTCTQNINNVLHDFSTSSGFKW